MIYLKSTSQLCDSYRSVTLYLQLSIKEQPQIHWLEKILSLSQKNSPEAKWLHGWLVQWLSIPFWAPVLRLSALPRFSYTSLLRHNRASLPSKATFNARFHINRRIPWIFEETFSKKNVFGISFVYVSRIGSQDHPIAGNEKGIIITGWNRSGFIPIPWIPKLCQQTVRSKWRGWLLNNVCHKPTWTCSSIRNRKE